MSYISPINIKEITNDIETTLENEIVKIVRSYGIAIDKDELIKALNYDRSQYEKGYYDGVQAHVEYMASIDNHEQCYTCKFYEGVHNMQGHAPCSFWNIGGVLWNDYCSRWKGIEQ